ncbi:VTC domain-containing protein [Ruminiclostridium sufflavum DSM 19573]|uniref:VTC domain-containing protein n=1 Tax=Ruminiclostridium sufflavum DSM 19573 TaxID=1121337 RepID=A0A318XMS0_9FIRM|nr:polyphosphate polymerase domain-containing protein [Ruminiclostridium sufflavum]PYG87222.1 VTC domain-containing protein [Ruminiclostridium sufflavum DSM 19573]
MSISTFKRYELKFLLSKKQFDALMPKLLEKMNPDKNCQNGKSYSIYNIYYDTPDNHLIRTSLSKPSYKEKLRLRSYTIPTSLEDKVFLELKKKTAGIVHKRRATMTLREAYEFVESGRHPAAANYINEQVINEISYFLSCYNVRPAAYISYSRIALFGKEDKAFRITFDRNIQTRRNDLCLEAGCSGEQLLGIDQYLMEVKISGSVPIWLTEILSDLKIYKTSFSKYGTEYKKYCMNKNVKAHSVA